MNISKQLMTMLGLSLLGFILIFSISLSKMDQVFEKTNTCNVNSLPSILVMDDLLQGIYRIRLILWETTTSDSHDANEFQKLMERYKTAKTKFDKDYKSYELLLSDAKDKELYEKEGKLFAQYSLVVDQILKLASEGKLSDAKSLFIANRPTAQELGKTFEDHMDYNQVLASQDAKIAVETKQSATFWMIIIALIISTSVIALSVLIRKNIMDGVHLIRDSITNFVRTKELRFRITYAKQNEIKEIVDSFNDLVNTLEHTITDAKTSSNENASVSHELSTTSMQIGRNAEQSSTIVENTIHEIDSIKSFVQETAKLSENMKEEILDAGKKLGNAKDEIISLRHEVDQASLAETALAS